MEERFGPWTLGRRVAVGNFADVTEASRGSDAVALKRLHAHSARDTELRALFVRESRIATSVPPHPGLVRGFEVGEVDGRPCVLVDDMIDTAATLTEGVKALAAMGAGPIFTGATHALFSGKARQHLEEAPIDQVIVTNTVPIPEEKQFSKLHVLSIAPLIASALRAVFEDTSVSEIFGGANQV